MIKKVLIDSKKKDDIKKNIKCRRKCKVYIVRLELITSQPNLNTYNL